MRRHICGILALLLAALPPAAVTAAPKKSPKPLPKALFESSCPKPRKGSCSEKGEGWMCSLTCSPTEACNVDVYCFKNPTGLIRRICLVPTGPADCCYLQLGGRTQGWCLQTGYEVMPLK